VVVGVAAALERGVQGVLEFALAGRRRRRRREGSEGRVTGGRGGKVSVVWGSVGEESMAKSLWCVCVCGRTNQTVNKQLTASSRRSWPSRPYAIVVVVVVSSLLESWFNQTKHTPQHTHQLTRPSWFTFHSNPNYTITTWLTNSLPRHPVISHGHTASTATAPPATPPAPGLPIAAGTPAPPTAPMGLAGSSPP